VQEVLGPLPDWDTSVSDSLFRGCRWPWSSPYIVVTPTWWNSHAAFWGSSALLALVPLQLFGPPLIQYPIYPRPSQTQPRSQSQRLATSRLGGSCSSTSRGSKWQLKMPVTLLFLRIWATLHLLAWKLFIEWASTVGCLLSCLSSVTTVIIRVHIQRITGINVPPLNNLLAHNRPVHALYYCRRKDTGGQRYRVCVFIYDGITVYVDCLSFVSKLPFCLLAN
jgi:hypothetical protein